MAGAEKKAGRERRTLVFTDESGFYLLPGVVRTYGPRGETPVLEEWQTHDHWSMMSALTMDGRLYTQGQATAFKGVHCVRFLHHLQRSIGPRLLVIWDRSPIHRSREIKTFLAEGGGRRIHLELLPPYAPELNPDEGVWQHLKHVELRNLSSFDVDELRYHLHLAVLRIRRKPHLLTSFFQEAGLDL